MKRMKKSGAGALLTLCLLVCLTAQALAAQTAGTEVTAPRRSGCDAATIHYTDAAGTEQEIPFRETADGYVYTRPQGVSAQQVTVEYFSTVQWDSGVYTITVTKTGTVFREDGTAQQVTDYPVSSGDPLYEGDVLTAAAVLRQGQYPADNDETYTGKFTYSFLYSDGSGEGSTTATGRFTASGNTAPLVVTASPLTSRKLWTQTADTSWYSAEKSAFTLTTARQLAGLALLVNNGTDDFSGKTVRLGADIVLRNDDGTNGTRLWDGIGKYHRFAGTFDGGGHTISQMTAGAGGTASSGNAALFLNCEGALIRDLTVSGTAEGGRAAGLVLDMTGTTLRSCMVQVLVTATGSGASGGIAGTVSGDSLLDHCVNVYAVSGGDSVGGLAGKLEGSTVQDSVNYGMITGSGTNGGLGGLVGSTASGTLLRCANYGTVSGRSWYTGGITGILGSTAQAVLRDCCNAASVTGGHAVYSKAVVGGLAGRGNVYTMQNCFNSGAVSAADTLKGAAGGVLGTDGGSSKSSRTAVWYLDSACAAAVGSGTAGQSGISACTAQELAGTAVLNAINGDRCFSRQGKGFPELTTVPTGYAVCGRVTGAAGPVDVRLTQGGRLAAQVQTADAFAFYILTDDGYSLTLSAEGCVSRRMAVPAGTAGDLGTLALCRPGDVNMDGAVDVYDLQRLYEHLCGIDRLTDGYALLLSDMDGSGAVDEQDLRQLHAYCLGGSSAAD